MKPLPKSKGPWLSRVAIRLFTLLLAILIYWLLGFFVEDVESIPGPQYEAIEVAHIDKNLIQRQELQAEQIAALSREIDNQKESQRLIGSSSQNLQQTINQLLELQKLGMEKNVAFSETQQANVTASLQLFLESQQKYQALNQSLSEFLQRKQNLEKEKRMLEQQLDSQRKPARLEFDKATEKHRLRLAFLQLAVLLPLLGFAAYFVIKKRGSIYFPLSLAFACATLLKVALVIHDYFPSRYIKYILISGMLLAVARILIYFIQTIARPKSEALLKQYREGYEAFLCPVCEYPIRIGPRKFLFWTRRTVNRMVVPGGQADGEEIYTCPSCGTNLFEQCPSCQKTRHALLPNCGHCGSEKTFSSDLIHPTSPEV